MHFKHNTSGQPVTLTISQTSDAYCPVYTLSQFLKLRGTFAGTLFAFANSPPVSYLLLPVSHKSFAMGRNVDDTAWLASTTFYLYYIYLVITFVLPFDLERGRYSMTGVHNILPLLHLSSHYRCLTIRSRTWTLQHVWRPRCSTVIS